MRKYLIVLLLFPAISIYSQNIDIEILRHVNLNRNKQLDEVFKVITNSAAPIAIGAPVILFGIGLIEKDTVIIRKAACICITVASTAVIATILKYSIKRKRPFETYPDINNVTDGGSPSFPSGHTSDVFALASSVSLAYPKWYVIIPSYAWAGAVGYSRMDLGVHYPSDVLIGAAIGAGSAYLCYKGQQLLKRKRN